MEMSPTQWVFTVISWGSNMEHVTFCNEVTTTFSINKILILFQIKVNNCNGNIFKETSQNKHKTQ